MPMWLEGVTREEFLTHVVRCLEYSIERGDCGTFRAHMEDWGNDEEVVRVHSDPGSPLGRRIAAAIEANEALVRVEKEFGEGAALRLDHPFNQKLIRHGHKAPGRIEAARRRAARADFT